MTSKLGIDLPHRWAGNDFWSDIEISHALAQFKGIRAIFARCQFNAIFNSLGNEETDPHLQCGGEGHYLITRTSELTGNVYTDYACLHHAKMWVNPNDR